MLSMRVEVKIATNNKPQKQNKNVNSAGKRVEVPEVKTPVQEPTVESHTKPAVVATPAQVDTRRKKQARPDKKRDDFDREEDGPRKQQRNRSSQNQVKKSKKK